MSSSVQFTLSLGLPVILINIEFYVKGFVMICFLIIDFNKFSLHLLVRFPIHNLFSELPFPSIDVVILFSLFSKHLILNSPILFVNFKRFFVFTLRSCIPLSESMKFSSIIYRLLNSFRLFGYQYFV